jgi:hypothetical protein
VFDMGARGVDVVVRLLLSLVREPGAVQTPDDLRAFFTDFVVPVILHESGGHRTGEAGPTG